MITAIYVTYFNIYLYCSLDHMLPKDLWRGCLVNNFLSTTLYITNLMYSGSLEIDVLPCNSQVKYVTIK